MKSCNPLPKGKILDCSKLKEFPGNILYLKSLDLPINQRLENIVGKGMKCCYLQFLLFPQCFQNPSFEGLITVGIVW